MTLKELMSDESTHRKVAARISELEGGEKLDKMDAVRKVAAEFGCVLSEDEMKEIQEKMENEEIPLDELNHISGGEGTEWYDYIIGILIS